MLGEYSKKLSIKKLQLVFRLVFIAVLKKL